MPGSFSLSGLPGYALLFSLIFAEQIGLPLPAAPVLLAAGAVAGAGGLSLSLAILLSLMASLLANTIWYEIGRRRGDKVIRMLCRISLEPDSCARRTERFFSSYGAPSLLVSKFIPGLHMAAPPLSGVFRMKRWRFLLLNTIGTIVWVLAFAGLGYVFSREIDRIIRYAVGFSHWLVALTLIGALAGYIGWKYLQRRRFLQQLMMARITPEDLKQKLDAGEPVAIVDVRHPLDLYAHPQVIPGALRIPLEQITQRSGEIPRDREVVLCCTCPNEASSARATRLLQQQGIQRVRPLAGGYQAWRERGYAVEPFDFSAGTVPAAPRPVWAF